MSNAARSVFVFSWYLLALGATLLLVPNLLLGIFGIAATEEVWIRVVGLLAGIIGYYYLQASRYELTAFLRATVWGRMTVLLCFAAFVVAGLAPPILLLFGVVDASGALWTALTLRSPGGSDGVAARQPWRGGPRR